MADRSGIEWTEATWNPVTGCDRVSAGCDNCYALALAKRLKAMGAAKYQNDGDPRTSGPGFGITLHPAALNVPRRWREPRLVFVNSMSDLFHARVPPTFVRQVFEVMVTTPQHTYQILTKRARRLRRLADSLPWPPNVWMGVSVENTSQLHRVDDLRSVPAAVRFLSAEPLLGPLITEEVGLNLDGIDWLITGGESGPRARPIDPQWVREIRDACLSSNVAFFHKQWGGRTPKAGGRELDGLTWDQLPRQRSAARQRECRPRRRNARGNCVSSCRGRRKAHDGVLRPRRARLERRPRARPALQPPEHPARYGDASPGTRAGEPAGRACEREGRPSLSFQPVGEPGHRRSIVEQARLQRTSVTNVVSGVRVKPPRNGIEALKALVAVGCEHKGVPRSLVLPGDREVSSVNPGQRADPSLVDREKLPLPCALSLDRESRLPATVTVVAGHRLSYRLGSGEPV
jgi:protein gp37